MVIRQEERRCFPRINLHAPVRFQIKGEPGFDNTISDDVSLGGLSFISDTYISPATDLILEINVLSRIIKALGKIVWSCHLPHSDRSLFGIEFTEFEASDRDYLSCYVNMLLNQQ